jgi:hypothetical protein
MTTALHSLLNESHAANGKVRWYIASVQATKVGAKATLVAELASYVGDRPKKVTLELPDLMDMSVEKKINKYVSVDDYYDHVPLKNIQIAIKSFDLQFQSNGPAFESDGSPEKTNETVTLYADALVTSDEVECPVCEGSGRDTWDTDEYSHSSGHYTTGHSAECDTCDGSGKIELEDSMYLSLDPEPEIDQATGEWVREKSRWFGSPD